MRRALAQSGNRMHGPPANRRYRCHKRVFPVQDAASTPIPRRYPANMCRVPIAQRRANALGLITCRELCLKKHHSALVRTSFPTCMCAAFATLEMLMPAAHLGFRLVLPLRVWSERCHRGGKFRAVHGGAKSRENTAEWVVRSLMFRLGQPDVCHGGTLQEGEIPCLHFVISQSARRRFR